MAMVASARYLKRRRSSYSGIAAHANAALSPTTRRTPSMYGISIDCLGVGGEGNSRR